jgi:hypothetical protein
MRYFPASSRVLIPLTIIVLVFCLAPGSTHAAQQNAASVYIPAMFYSYFTGFTNHSFESGTSGWVVQSNQADQVVTTAAARSGVRSAALGNGNNYRVASIAQQVTIPQQEYTATYYQWVESLELCQASNNRVMVYINGEPYQHYNICGDSSNGKWVKIRIHLAPYKGQTVVFRLEFESSTILNNYLYVDDFSFEVP